MRKESKSANCRVADEKRDTPNMFRCRRHQGDTPKLVGLRVSTLLQRGLSNSIVADDYCIAYVQRIGRRIRTMMLAPPAVKTLYVSSTSIQNQRVQTGSRSFRFAELAG